MSPGESACKYQVGREKKFTSDWISGTVHLSFILQSGRTGLGFTRPWAEIIFQMSSTSWGESLLNFSQVGKCLSSGTEG